MAALAASWRLPACRGVPDAPPSPLHAHSLRHDLPRQGVNREALLAHQHDMEVGCGNVDISRTPGRESRVLNASSAARLAVLTWC